MGSKQKRDNALRDIHHSWPKLTHRLGLVFENLRELSNKEQQKASIKIGNIKEEKIEEGERKLNRVKSIVEEQKRISKGTEHWLEQCRLLIIHQKKKIQEFEKNL